MVEVLPISLPIQLIKGGFLPLMPKHKPKIPQYDTDKTNALMTKLLAV